MIEFLVFVLIVAAIATFALTSVRSDRAKSRDRERKSDINAIAFQLESYFEKNNFYPETVTPLTLLGIDSEVLNDPAGVTLGQQGSEYNYRSRRCDQTKCGGYELSVELENEAPYIKPSLNQ